MAVNEEIMIRLKADASNYMTSMQAASAKAEQLSTSMEQPRSAGERLTSGLSKTALGVGALSAAIGVAAVASFAQFDAKMSEVKVNTGATGDELARLREAALNASRTSVYSAEDAADAINELAKAGMSTSDILSGGLSAALTLAATDSMSTEDATRYLTSAMTEFNIKGKDAAKVSDALAAGAGKALGGVSDMGNALSMVGGTAHMMGASMQETTGTLAAMANAGNIGSEAGTELRSALIGLMSPSKQVQGEMDDLGLHLYDAQGHFVGIANFAGQLQDKLGKLPEAERNQAMGILFSNAAMSAANVLYKEGKGGIEKWTQAVSESGYAAKVAAGKTDNLKGDLTKFGNTAQDVLIGIGSAANGPLRSVTQGATALLNTFRSMPESAQQWVIGGGMIVGAVAGIHKVMGSTESSTSSLVRTMGDVFDPMQRLSNAGSSLSQAWQILKGSTMTYDQQMQTFGTTMSAGTARTTAAKTALGGLSDLMGGPWGIAMTGATIALGVLVSKQQDAKQRTDDLTNAMQNGQSAASKFTADLKTGDDIDWGWWQKATTGIGSLSDALDKAGVSSKTFVSAETGNKQAIEQVNEALGKAFLQGKINASGEDEIKAKLEQGQKSYKKSEEAIKAASEAKDQDTKKSVQNTTALAGLNKATDQETQSTQKVAKAKDIMAAAFGASTDGINQQAEALGQTMEALKDYYGLAQGSFDAETKLGKAFQEATKSVKENGATLDANTEKGESNRNALSGVVSAILAKAEADAKAGKSTQEVTKDITDGHDKLVGYAKQMGMSSDQAEEFARQMGVTSGDVQDLINKVNQANTTPLKIDDQATKTLNDVKLSAEGLPDGKTIEITGKNKDAMEAIAQVVGAKIDKKTGKLDLDKQQYDIALALANGAVINPKTGELKGDNTLMMKKLAETNGWKIDPKTGELNGDNSKMWQKLAEANGWHIDEKTGYMTGDNREMNRKLAEANGWRIDEKTGEMVGDNSQMWQKLAEANGWRLDSKTGEINGNNSNMWQKFAEAQGWRIDGKTGVIFGDNGPFMAAKGAVENTSIGGKTVDIGGNASGFWSTINGILGHVFNINIGSNGHAIGGLITGPGTGTSDSIPSMLSNGEFVIQADAVKKYGTGMLNAINWQRYAEGGLVPRYTAMPVPTKVEQTSATPIQYVYHNTFKIVNAPSKQAVAQEVLATIQSEGAHR
ncbi:phage tail tape measure protein [Bifidobacterium sp. ESL0745]|uniref:phage tail tape measure protein n=1 Tax=Bifidobacterium sp. ESL0745 TaxID=2983226 RepID=UPI0023F86DEB|nr:phage tail tape measure protein [Bifidobacterium sp. ESL0745]MDF7665735.1 phage tail tape measure protein [Bifidobacterium sp. ESL0745]